MHTTYHAMNRILGANVGFVKLLGYHLVYKDEAEAFSLLSPEGKVVVEDICITTNDTYGEERSWQEIFFEDEDGFTYLPDMAEYGGLRLLVATVGELGYTLDIKAEGNAGAWSVELTVNDDDGFDVINVRDLNPFVPLDTQALELLNQLLAMDERARPICLSVYRQMGAL